MASSQLLPHDMLYEIMSRSRDVQTLAKMRTMSQQLNSESYGSEFTSLHLVTGFLFRFLKQNKYYTQFIDSCADSECSHQSFSPFDFLPLPVKVLASSDSTGLFYCESTESASMRNPDVFNHYVCKPVTREWLQIPKPRTKNEKWGYYTRAGLVVISSSPLHYKIIRLCQEQVRNIASYKCQVFDSDAPAKWKLLKESLKLKGTFFESLTSDPPLTVNGKLHFATSDSCVACFDPLLEKWEIFAMPDACNEGSLHPKLTKHNGKLGLLLDQSAESVLFWVMDDYNNKVWTERSPICPKAITGLSSWATLLGFCSSETALFQNSDNVAMYSLKKNSPDRGMIKRMKTGHYSIDSVFKLRSDFERMGWKTETDSKGYMARQRQRARIPKKLITIKKMREGLSRLNLRAVSVCLVVILMFLVLVRHCC